MNFAQLNVSSKKIWRAIVLLSMIDRRYSFWIEAGFPLWWGQGGGVMAFGFPLLKMVKLKLAFAEPETSYIHSHELTPMLIVRSDWWDLKI